MTRACFEPASVFLPAIACEGFAAGTGPADDAADRLFADFDIEILRSVLFQSPPRAFFTEKLVDAARQSESTASRTVLLPDPFRPLSGATKGVGGKIMEFSFAAKLRP